MAEIQCLKTRIQPGKTQRLLGWLKGLQDRPEELRKAQAAGGILLESLFLERAEEADYRPATRLALKRDRGKEKGGAPQSGQRYGGASGPWRMVAARSGRPSESHYKEDEEDHQGGG